MQIGFQIATAILTVLAILQKKKWKMMLYYTINNILCAFMYLAFSRTATMVICIIAAVRTFIFMFYSIKNIKPNIVWLIIFECAFIITTILTWQDALDLMPLFAMLAAGYGSWQDNAYILRICYMINMTLYVIYKAIIGAYISMSVEALDLVCTIVCFIYYCLLKKETPILDLIFKKNKTEVIEKAVEEKINDKEEQSKGNL